MTPSRPRPCTVLAAGLGLMLSALPLAAVPDGPAASALQAGDFLFPKRPNAIVPYSSDPDGSPEEESAGWLAARNTYLKELESIPQPTASDQERYQLLSGLSYDAFRVLYLEDEDPSQPTPYGAILPFAVGHVAIVFMKEGAPWIVEALMKGGVRELSYDSWLAERHDAKIWHARLRGSSDAQRATIAAEARKHANKPYRFWNFDLLDDSGFYCSKLAWLSVQRTHGVSLDRKDEPKRLLWYSPKQMLKSRLLDLLYNPGRY